MAGIITQTHKNTPECEHPNFISSQLVPKRTTKSSDRSKYQNPDMPPGYQKKQVELRYKIGTEIDGYHYIYAPLLYEAHIDERSDYEDLSNNLVLSDDENGATRKRATEKKKNDDMQFIKEVSKKQKSGCSDNEISYLDECKAYVKRRGREKLRQSCRADTRSDSSDSSSSSYRSQNLPPTKKQKYTRSDHSDSSSSSYRSQNLPPTKKKKYTRSDSSDSSSSSYRSQNLPPTKKQKDTRSDSSDSSSSSYRRQNLPPTKKQKYTRSDSSDSSSSSYRRQNLPPTKKQKYTRSDSSDSSSSSYRRQNLPPTKKQKDTRSDSSDSSSSSYRSQNLPPTKKQKKIPERKIGKESVGDSKSLHCDVCNIYLNGIATYSSHVNGKKHKKNQKRKPQDLAKAPSELVSTYPKIPPGVRRKKVQGPAKAQEALLRQINCPCPGLDVVTEIQGLKEVKYYCSLCYVCTHFNLLASHISGFRHQLKIIKHFKPDIYERIRRIPRHEVEIVMKKAIKAIFEEHGCGKMMVEVDEYIAPKPMTQQQNMNYPSTSSYEESQPGPSREATGIGHSGMSFAKMYDKASVPSQESADFYCEYCLSHMNSLDMWNSHITGKRHLNNLKKLPGELPSRSKTVPLRNRRSHLLDRLEREYTNEPFIGLNQIQETYLHLVDTYTYNCHMCSSVHTDSTIIEHLLGFKHRVKYLNHIKFPEREMLHGMDDYTAESFLRDMCSQVEYIEGRGEPAVHIAKWLLNQK